MGTNLFQWFYVHNMVLLAPAPQPSLNKNTYFVWIFCRNLDFTVGKKGWKLNFLLGTYGTELGLANGFNQMAALWSKIIVEIDFRFRK